MVESSTADKSRRDFFISYNHHDTAWAEWIAWQLDDAGYTTYLQAWDFRPGGNFVGAMQKGATIAQRTIAVLSPDYLNSQFTQPEWYAAFAQDPIGEKGLLLPIRVRECKPEGLLGQILYLDLIDQKPEQAKKLLLAGVELKRAKPETAPVYPGWKKPAAPEPRFPGALPPIWNIKQGRNRNFTGREELLDQLRESLTSGEHAAVTQAIKGLGGVGKTQVALEYAYRHAGDYDTVWWVHAENTAALAEEFAALAGPLDLPEKDATERQVTIDAVKNWLEQHTNWLLVFDNVPAPPDVEKYLLQGKTGHTIITSRYQAWTGWASPLSLDVMIPAEAVAFLLKRSGQADRDAAQKLAEELGYFPLALEQAVAYAETAAISLRAYLELYLTQRQQLWAKQQPPSGYEHTVATTWAVSLDVLREESPAALALLDLCAFMAPDNIPLDVIRDGAEFLPQPLGETAKDKMALNKAAMALQQYSLGKIDLYMISFHRLVPEVVRDRLSEKERKTWAATAVGLINTAIPYDSDDVRTWELCARLLPHALASSSFAELYGVALEETGRLLNQCGLYLHSKGLPADAIKHYGKALAINERLFGKDYPSAVTILTNLGNAMRELGDLSGAKENFERALTIDEKTYGKNHPEVASDLNNLGNVLQDLGDLAGAKKNYERALKIGFATLGENHPDVATRLNNLGSVLQDLGDLAGAKKNYERALKIDEKTYGKDHPEVATDLNNLGSVLLDMGDLAGAKKNFERALEIGFATLGVDHPAVATQLNNLGSVLLDMGDLAGAKENFERALAIGFATLGEDHPAVATQLNNLGLVLLDMGDLAGAKKNFERAWAVTSRHFGREHPLAREISSSLGSVLKGLGDEEGARRHFERLAESAPEIGWEQE